jgi:hypothetical protein
MPLKDGPSMGDPVKALANLIAASIASVPELLK